MRRATVMLALLLLALPATVLAADPALLQACRAELDARNAGWQLAMVDEDVAAFARELHEDPLVAYGDFDGDGSKDVAMLVSDGNDTHQIAICLSRGTTPDLHVIADPYCGDGIAVSKKGARYHDFETESEGRFSSDGVFAYCFEKAGATWIIQNGQPRRIVNSD